MREPFCDCHVSTREKDGTGSDTTCAAHLADGRAFECPYRSFVDAKSADYPCEDARPIERKRIPDDRPPVGDVRIVFIPREADHWVDLEKEEELGHDALTRAEFYVHNVLNTNEGEAVKLERCYEGHLLYMMHVRP